MFNEIDTDFNGLIDKSEIASAMKRLGKLDSQVDRILGQMRKDSINLDEFREVLLEPKAVSCIPEARQAASTPALNGTLNARLQTDYSDVALLKKEHEKAVARLHAEHEQHSQKLCALSGVLLEQLKAAMSERNALQTKVAEPNCRASSIVRSQLDALKVMIVCARWKTSKRAIT